jgi:hypothetical protein
VCPSSQLMPSGLWVVQKMMNGLMNRLSESNLEPTWRDMHALYKSHSTRTATTILLDLVMRLGVSSSQVRRSHHRRSYSVPPRHAAV